MAKNKQSIKFEAEVSGFKKEIEEMRKSITSLNKELKLNQEQLKGNENDSNLLTTRVETLSKEYEQQTKIVENTNKVYEKTVELFGENSKEAQTWKDKLVEAETKQQKIKNALDEANKKLAEQSSNLIENGKKWQEHGEKISKVGDKIEKVGNKLSIVSAGIGAIAGGSLKASLDFESAFAGVEKTVDGTTEQLANLKQGILDMSTELPSSAVEISAVAESAGQLGIQTDNVLAFTRTMIDLGNSTNLSADEASSSLAKFANIVNMSADDYDKLGSVIVDLGNNFATTERDIVEMATRLAATGELTGLTEAQIMGLATAMSSVGIEAEAGGSAMSKLLQKMSTAVETGKSGKLTLEDLAKVSGTTAKDFKKAFKEDSAQALSSFIEGLNNTERNGKSAIAVLQDLGITDVRMTNTVLSLANAHGVMGNALKTADKAWKQNTALTNEANKRYATTESQLQMLKNEVVKLGIEFGNELAPSLKTIINDAKPLLNTVSSAVKKFSELDSTTKQNIIRAGAFVTAIGPVTKILGQVTSGVGSVTSSIGKVTEAVGVMKTGVKSANSEVNLMSSAFSAIASPAGLATLAVGALTAALIYYITYETEAQKEAKEFANKMSDARKSLEDYNKSIDDTTSANLAHINSVDKLKDELKTLVDENGKVKDGYKSRVDFIINELNKALGTEYKLNGDIIDSYKDLQEEIDKTIEKKRAETILNSKEKLYSNAIEIEKQAVEDMKEAQEKLGMGYDEANEKLKGLQDEYSKAMKMVGINGLIKATGIQKEIDALQNKINAYSDAEYRVKDSTEKIKSYQDDYEKFVEGKYSEIGKTIINSTEDWNKKTLEENKKNIEEQGKTLEAYKSIYKETGNEVSLELTQQAQKNLEELAKDLRSRTNTVDSLGKEEIEAWKQLATSSYDTYVEIISEMSPEMQKEIQAVTGEIALGTPGAEIATRTLAIRVTDELEKSTEARKSALETLQGFMSGLTDDEQRELLKEAGIEDVDEVMKGIKEGNLSEEQGKNVLKGILNGLNDENWNSQLRAKASGLAKQLSGLLEITPKIGAVQGASQALATIQAVQQKASGHADGLAYVPYNNYVARLHEGERVLSKKENAEYIRNNISNKNSRNVTVNIYPQTITEGEMHKVSRFVNREWGGRN